MPPIPPCTQADHRQQIPSPVHVESPANQAAVIVLGNTGYVDEMRPFLDERAC